MSETQPPTTTPTIAQLQKLAGKAEPTTWLPDWVCEEFNVSGYHLSWEGEQQNRLTCQTLFNYPFGSDEVAVAELYYFDSCIMLMREKYGDKTDDIITVVSLPIYAVFARYLKELEVEGWLKERNQETRQTIKPSNYLVSFSEVNGQLAVHIKDPKWMLEFPRMFEDHDAYYNGKRVAFVEWANPSEPSRNKESGLIIVSLPDGGNTTVHGAEIDFVIKGTPAA